MSSLDVIRIALIGMGATVVMDAWAFVLRRMGVPTLDFALVGRWVGHLAHGRFAHESIRAATPVAHEGAIGWATHYGIGIAFAGLLAGMTGMAWLDAPTLLPALAFGVGSVAAPLLVMQPAMGLGIASARTPTPWRNRARSLINHVVFGVGLYVSALLLAWLVNQMQ